MKPRPVGHGSLWPAHGYCESPSTFCAGWSGSQVNWETRAFAPTGTAPAEVRVRQETVRVLAGLRDLHERAEAPAVVDGLRDVDRSHAVLVGGVEAAHEGDVDRAVRADRRIDIRARGGRRRRRRHLDGL